jgi:hypothetical protein
MVIRRLALCALLLAMVQAYLPGTAQATHSSSSNRPATPASAAPAATPDASGSAAGKTDCNGAPCDDQQPRMIVTLPAPAPLTWPWHDRILWGACLVLAILGYVGVMLAVSTLRKIERQSASAEATASAAQDSARAALLIAQSIIDSERPWILISVEPSRLVDNSFSIMATNRGRTPATITSALDQIKIAIDEAHLPATAQYPPADLAAPAIPIILLPAESTVIKSFGRDDLQQVCESDETFRRVQSWEEKLFICGKVVYKDLIAPPQDQFHETTWCCWYIHGRQKSGLVIAGPPSYNLHT